MSKIADHNDIGTGCPDEPPDESGIGCRPPDGALQRIRLSKDGFVLCAFPDGRVDFCQGRAGMPDRIEQKPCARLAQIVGAPDQNIQRLAFRSGQVGQHFRASRDRLSFSPPASRLSKQIPGRRAGSWPVMPPPPLFRE